jgi:hypothetical protein
LRYAIALICSGFLLSGCSGFVHDEQLDEAYRLVAVDAMEDMMVCRSVGNDCSGDGLPGPTIFAAGADHRYIVIARHPDGDKAVSEYFYLIKRPASAAVIGPFTRLSFDAEREQLGLPAFTRTFESLR